MLGERHFRPWLESCDGSLSCGRTCSCIISTLCQHAALSRSSDRGRSLVGSYVEQDWQRWLLCQATTAGRVCPGSAAHLLPTQATASAEMENCILAERSQVR